MGEGPIDPGQRRLAERRLLGALRRHQRRSPLSPDARVDTLVAELRADSRGRPPGHRGTRPLTLTEGEMRAVVDGMVASGQLVRRGHRVRLPIGAGPAFDPIMRERVDLLLATLTAAGASPPPAEGVAARLGVPSALLDQLRAAGELVSIGPRIDLTRQSWDRVAARLDRLAASGPLSVALVRDDLETARRFAERILQHWSELRGHS
ncbi:MAG TPA: hypothetical protein VGQ66_03285 [Candidatus Limnocylindria bacterium]|nr:hypothetical protein [Candidatus Limnocylindria bacterium]